MTRTRLLVLAATAALATLLTGCAQTPPGSTDPLDGVTSACDEHGHRIYKWTYGLGSAHPVGGIAVVPNDVTCVKATIR